MSNLLRFKGYQARQLREGLSSAYRHIGSLKQLLLEEMDIRLENEVNINQRYGLVVGDLVDWADEQGRLADLIHFATLRNPYNADLKRFCDTFGITIGHHASDSCQTPNVPFDWLDPIEDAHLQGLWRTPIELLDVNFLQRGLAQVSSICRVDGGKGGMGTGFLIGKDLILTNCHVIFGQERDPSPEEQADLSGVTCRFRYLSDEGEEKGKVVPLVASGALVKWSSVRNLDYSLLKIQSDPDSTVCPLTFREGQAWELPLKNDGLHILQHPKGETLKLALGWQSVTGVYLDRARVQYVSQTHGGSSGSPCFNDQWELVAMHQSLIDTSWGTVRQGILFQSIYQEIADFLH